MDIKVKPIFILNKGENAFRYPDGTRDIITDERTVAQRVTRIRKELRKKLQLGPSLLEDAIVTSEEELVSLKNEATQADALLIYFIGWVPLQRLFTWRLPIIAFGGPYVPTLPLYALGVEKDTKPDITIALDYQDIDETLQVLAAKKKLQNTQIALFGLPPEMFSRWHHLPDFELAREKLGVRFCSVEIREVASRLPEIKEGEAQTLAERWLSEAAKVVEPSKTDIVDVARVYLILAKLLKEQKANALGINCLEFMGSLNILAPCYALTRLRDEGIPAACENDIIALLSMMLLGYIADRPAFMGNTVGAIPEDNILRISHCVVPTKIAGFNQPPQPHTLKNYHGGYRRGVTAFVEVNTGQEVTMARLSRNLDKIQITNGMLTECRDTILCRSTFTIKVSDVRPFVHSAQGNHQSMVLGNCSRQLKTLCNSLGINSIVV